MESPAFLYETGEWQSTFTYPAKNSYIFCFFHQGKAVITCIYLLKTSQFYPGILTALNFLLEPVSMLILANHWKNPCWDEADGTVWSVEAKQHIGRRPTQATGIHLLVFYAKFRRNNLHCVITVDSQGLATAVCDPYPAWSFTFRIHCLAYLDFVFATNTIFKFSHC